MTGSSLTKLVGLRKRSSIYDKDTGMQLLIIGMVIFYGIHLVPMTPLKPVLHRSLGEIGYKAVFSLLSLAGLGVMIWGFVRTGSGPDAARIVFHPQEWGYTLVMPFVAAGLICLVASGLKGHIKAWIKHPMSAGIALWALGHLFANGSLGEVLFFGGFLAYSIMDILVSLARGNNPDHEPRLSHDVIAVVLGLAVFAAALRLHPILIGVSVI